MTPEITITNTTPVHLRLMADAMSEDSAVVAAKTGYTRSKLLWHSYRNSLICRTAFISGKIAAIWGISGILFNETAHPWLILTPETQQHPMRVAFRYRKELKNMLKMFPVLEEWVPEDNQDSIRMLQLMGFRIDKNTVRIGDQVFRHAEKRV